MTIFKFIIAMITAILLTLVGSLTIAFFSETIGLHPIIMMIICFFYGYKVVPNITKNFME